MQSWDARNQCKACRHGQHVRYHPSHKWQMIKCGITGEIKVKYEQCDIYDAAMPVIDKTNREKGITQSGLIFDVGTGLLRPCKKGRLPDHVPLVTMLADCF